MKRVSVVLCVLAIFALEASQLSIRGSEPLKAQPLDFVELAKMRLPAGEIFASNIYDAVNQTLMLAARSDPRLAHLKFEIGPTTPRPQCVGRRITVTNETFLELLRSWGEHFGYKIEFTKSGLRLNAVEGFVPEPRP